MVGRCFLFLAATDEVYDCGEVIEGEDVPEQYLLLSCF